MCSHINSKCSTRWNLVVFFALFCKSSCSAHLSVSNYTISVVEPLLKKHCRTLFKFKRGVKATRSLYPLLGHTLVCLQNSHSAITNRETQNIGHFICTPAAYPQWSTIVRELLQVHDLAAFYRFPVKMRYKNDLPNAMPSKTGETRQNRTDLSQRWGNLFKS